MAEGNAPIHVAIVDDHTLFREGLARLLQTEPDIEVTAHSGSVAGAVEMLRSRPVDVLLLDFDLGQETAKDVLTAAEAIPYRGKTLVLTAGMSDADVVDVLRRGVAGIALKHTEPTLLVDIIRKVMAGENWLDQRFMRALVSAARPDPQDRKRRFTDRERAVLKGVFEGLSNKEVADRLKVSESSVKASLQQLFHKTGVHTRSQLVRIALESYSDQL